MITPQLLAFIRSQRAAGVADGETHLLLMGQGWSNSDIEQAFAMDNASGATRPSTPPPPQVPLTPVQSPSAARVVRPLPETNAAPSRSGSGRFIWIILVIVLVLVIGAAGAYAYYAGIRL